MTRLDPQESTRLEARLGLTIQKQPDIHSCGPTCLQSVYHFYHDDIPLEQVISETPRLDHGGTFAVFLGSHALARGYKATIYTYNLKVFDPTWFTNENVDLAERLRLQAQHKYSQRLRIATRGYLEFLRLGGKILFADLRPNLIRQFLDQGHPIITGLSATYLYRTAREYGPSDDYDDIRGVPMGHFVVLVGYNEGRGEVIIADPMQPNPPFEQHIYSLPIERVICSILLGILTYDANLLIIEPTDRDKRN
jgi:hypothetical protein